MQIIHHAISSHSSLDLTTADGDALHVLDLCGRNLGIDVPTKWISLWLPLVGDIEIDTPQYAWTLQRGDLLTWREQSLRVA
ncbi:MAG TPA: hypothetical protein PKZ76_15180, partial [Xanthomonadaceae bacterium]|nr:hypothetical protein [Xanthomonadaceae bacterium]